MIDKTSSEYKLGVGFARSEHKSRRHGMYSSQISKGSDDLKAGYADQKAIYDDPIPELDLTISASAVSREADRRLASGITVSVGGTPHLFQTDEASLARINGAVTLALLTINANPAMATSTQWGPDGSVFQWIVEDNSLVPMTPLDVIALGEATAGLVSRVVLSSRTIKNMTPIPADYTADSYWS